MTFLMEDQTLKKSLTTFSYGGFKVRKLLQHFLWRIQSEKTLMAFLMEDQKSEKTLTTFSCGGFKVKKLL